VDGTSLLVKQVRFLFSASGFTLYCRRFDMRKIVVSLALACVVLVASGSVALAQL
jgi:hypothetical protein